MESIWLNAIISENDFLYLQENGESIATTYHWPNLPRSLACSQKIVLNFVSNGSQRITVDKTKVGKEDTHEDGTPEELINGNLGKYWDGIRAWNLTIKPIVKVVSRWAVVDESKEREGSKTLVVDGTSSDEDLLYRYSCTEIKQM